jgi:Tol biopolymer transport system component
MKPQLPAALRRNIHCMIRTDSRNLLVSLLLTLTIVFPTFSHAQNRCGIEQITDVTTQTDSAATSLNADGSLLAFGSEANIGGGNPDGNFEIFLYDSNTNDITQITNDAFGDSHVPSINGDGTRIAFTSDANINGGNPEGNQEVFLYNSNTGTFLQITSEPFGDSNSSSISMAGSIIGFVSTSDINGGNPEGNREVYFYNANTNTITQITNETSGLSEPSEVSGDGSTITFISDANIGGGNPEGNFELYIYNVNNGAIDQITSFTSGNTFAPTINEDGTLIAFMSSANINGQNPGGNFGIYLYNRGNNSFTQIVNNPTGTSETPAIDGDGHRIAFMSRANINNGNPEGNLEIYFFNNNQSLIVQITRENTALSFVPSISEDGSRIAFHSDGDITGGNPDGNFEIYLADCGDPSDVLQAIVPTMGEWGLIGLALLLGTIGFIANKRNSMQKSPNN